MILAEGADSLEVEGSPDWVLEVISKSSIKKDTQTLPPLYWASQISEYWLVDPREDPARLTIFRPGDKAYEAVRKQGGWQKSAVFGASFRLRKDPEAGELPTYYLDVK